MEFSNKRKTPYKQHSKKCPSDEEEGSMDLERDDLELEDVLEEILALLNELLGEWRKLSGKFSQVVATSQSQAL